VSQLFLLLSLCLPCGFLVVFEKPNRSSCTYTFTNLSPQHQPTRGPRAVETASPTAAACPPSPAPPTPRACRPDWARRCCAVCEVAGRGTGARGRQRRRTRADQVGPGDPRSGAGWARIPRSPPRRRRCRWVPCHCLRCQCLLDERAMEDIDWGVCVRVRGWGRVDGMIEQQRPYGRIWIVASMVMCAAQGDGKRAPSDITRVQTPSPSDPGTVRHTTLQACSTRTSHDHGIGSVRVP
jgi:hypothetical protein